MIINDINSDHKVVALTNAQLYNLKLTTLNKLYTVSLGSCEVR